MSREKPWRGPVQLRDAALGTLTEVLYVVVLLALAGVVIGLCRIVWP